MSNEAVSESTGIGSVEPTDIHSRLVGDVELAEEVDEVVGARVGGELVRDEGLVEEIGEAARCTDVGDALQRVVARAIGRARLATLAVEEEGSRPE